MGLSRDILEKLNDEDVNTIVDNLDKIESINVSLAEKEAKKNPLEDIRQEKEKQINVVYEKLSNIDEKNLPSEYKKQLLDFHERNKELNEINGEIKKLEEEIEDLLMRKDSIEIDSNIGDKKEIPTVEAVSDEEVEKEVEKLKINTETSPIAISEKGIVEQAKETIENKSRYSSDGEKVIISRREDREQQALEEIRKKLLEEKNNIQETINNDDIVDINSLLSNENNDNSLKLVA